MHNHILMATMFNGVVARKNKSAGKPPFLAQHLLLNNDQPLNATRTFQRARKRSLAAEERLVEEVVVHWLLVQVGIVAEVTA